MLHVAILASVWLDVPGDTGLLPPSLASAMLKKIEFLYIKYYCSVSDENKDSSFYEFILQRRRAALALQLL